MLEECIARWRALPHAARSRVHLACTPMADPDEAAAIVNALQRHAAVVVQKSIAEGFGLTVAEAMWKARPVVASAVGGIVDQIVSGEHGLLIDDPHDLAAFGAAVETLLRDRAEAGRLGTNARARAGGASSSATATWSSTAGCSRSSARGHPRWDLRARNRRRWNRRALTPGSGRTGTASHEMEDALPGIGC